MNCNEGWPIGSAFTLWNHNVIILILIILIIVILILSYPFRSVIDLTDGIGAEIKNIWTIENYNLKLNFEKLVV